MLALFTKSWRKKAAIVALVFYALGIAAPAAALALADGGTHCLPMTATQATADSQHSHEAASTPHGHDAAAADHQPHSAPAADDHGVTGKCCGTFCFTALAPHVAPVGAPLMRVAAVSQLRVVHLFGHGADPIDRPPRDLLSI